MKLLLKDYLFILESDEKGLLKYISNSNNTCFVVHEGLLDWIKTLNIEKSNKIISEVDMKTILELSETFYKFLIISPNELSVKNQMEKYIGVKKAKQKRIYRLYNDIFTFATCSIPAHKVNLTDTGYSVRDEIKITLVTSLPRSGSTFFCDTFEQSGFFGHAREHIRQDTAYLVKKGFLDFKLFFTFVINNTISENNVFQTKIIDGFFLDMYNNMNDYDKAFVNKIFKRAKIIYLERENKISQAVSAYKSSLSGKYHSTDNGVSDFDAPYNFEKLNNTYNAYNQKENIWKKFILNFILKDNYYHIKYEDFAKNTKECFFNISSFCEIETMEYTESIYTKVSNKNSDFLKNKFKSDLINKHLL